MSSSKQSLKVYARGAIVDLERARVSVFDASFQSGDQVWEGLRAYNGAVFRLDAHLERLEHSAKVLRIGLPLNRAGIGAGRARDARGHEFYRRRAYPAEGLARGAHDLGHGIQHGAARRRPVHRRGEKAVAERPAAHRLRTINDSTAAPTCSIRRSTTPPAEQHSGQDQVMGSVWTRPSCSTFTVSSRRPTLPTSSA